MTTENTIWGIHAGKTGDAETLFFQKKVIALGWPDMGNLKQFSSRDDFKAKYAVIKPEASTSSISTSAGQLFRFVHEAKVGDLVVFPGKKDRLVHIGEITGEYEYRPSVDENYPNQRAVKWLKYVPRTRFSQGALYELGAAISFFQVKTYADEFFPLLEGKTPEVMIDDQSVAIVAEDIEDQTRDFVLKHLEKNLKGLPLEEFVKHILEKMGYHARLSRKNEPSVDIIATKDELGVEPPIIKVQVKSAPGKVSDKDVSALYGKVGSGGVGLLVTLGEFTLPANNFADAKGNLRLIDGTELVDIILEHYEELDPRYKGIIPLKKVYIPQSLESGDQNG
jgi:restriction system protein